MSSKKKQRRSNRNVKVPMKLNDHVIGNLSSKHNNNVSEVTANEARVTGIGESTESGGKSIGKDEIVQGELQGDKEASSVLPNSLNPIVNNTVESVVLDTDISSGDKIVNTVNDTNKSVNNMLNGDDICVNRIEKNENAMSYAKMVTKDEITTKLTFVPPVTTESGSEVVVFDEMLVQKGSERWNLTICGQFVGYNMNPNELRYNIRRMWSKFGVKDIVQNNGQFLFKFKSLEGMEHVIEKGPWMVNNKPLFVQRWNPEMNMTKIEPKKLPVWVKLVNIPLEAWSVDGISALASSVGLPIIMDHVTATICHKGMGNLGYARVLIEMSAEKQFKESIEIQYRDKDNNVKGTKTVKVVYDWKPPVCEHCKVFGHEFVKCSIRTKNPDELEKEKNNKEKEWVENKNERNVEGRNDQGLQGRKYNYKYQNNSYKNAATQRNDNVFGHSTGNCGSESENEGKTVENIDKEGFVNANNRKTKAVNKIQANATDKLPTGKMDDTRRGLNNNKVYKTKSTIDSQQTNRVVTAHKTIEKTLDSPKKAWNIQQPVLSEIKTTENKYAVLHDTDETVVVDGTSSIREEYNIEFPLIPTLQNQYAALIEEYERSPDVCLLWEKEQTFVAMLINNKKILTIEETKIWPLRMFQIYKKGWEAKWKTECPFIGKFQE